MKLRFTIDVEDAWFNEEWYVGDPDDQEESGFDEFEISGKGYGTLEMEIEIAADDISDLSDFQEFERWLDDHEPYLGEWSSQITNLEQQVQSSGRPEGREDDHLGPRSYIRLDKDSVAGIVVEIISCTADPVEVWSYLCSESTQTIKFLANVITAETMDESDILDNMHSCLSVIDLLEDIKPSFGSEAALAMSIYYGQTKCNTNNKHLASPSMFDVKVILTKFKNRLLGS